MKGENQMQQQRVNQVLLGTATAILVEATLLGLICLQAGLYNSWTLLLAHLILVAFYTVSTAHILGNLNSIGLHQEDVYKKRGKYYFFVISLAGPFYLLWRKLAGG